MVKKVKEKQKQKQKQKVKVSQNVKVIVGDIKQKRARKQVSKGKPSQKQAPSISLNIINPYQQLLPNPPQPESQKIKASETNPSNQANLPPNILRSLGFLGNQNQVIRNELRDLREFAENQQATYSSLLASQKEKETPENVAKPSKIEKMLKTKKMIMSSMNWENILKNEPKTEEKLVKEELRQPSVYDFLKPSQPIRQLVPEFSYSTYSRKKKALDKSLEQMADDLTQQAIMGAFQESKDEDEHNQKLDEIEKALWLSMSEDDQPPEQVEQAIQTSDYEEALDNSGGAGAEKPKRGRKPGPMSALEAPQKGESYQETYDKLRQYSEEDLRKKHLRGKKLYQYAEHLGIATKDPTTKKIMKVDELREVILDLLNINTKYPTRKDEFSTPPPSTPKPKKSKSSKKKKNKGNKKLVLEEDE